VALESGSGNGETAMDGSISNLKSVGARSMLAPVPSLASKSKRHHRHGLEGLRPSKNLSSHIIKADLI
jgi:hypothetical protein